MRIRLLATLCMASVVAGARAPVALATEAQVSGRDVSKLTLERPLKRIVEFRTPPEYTRYLTGRPAQKVFAGGGYPYSSAPGSPAHRQVSMKASTLSRTADTSKGAPPAVAFNNPKVEPGKVKWHGTPEEAMRAAQTSGKPILLFQMMGRLDDRFC